MKQRLKTIIGIYEKYLEELKAFSPDMKIDGYNTTVGEEMKRVEKHLRRLKRPL